MLDLCHFVSSAVRNVKYNITDQMTYVYMNVEYNNLPDGVYDKYKLVQGGETLYIILCQGKQP